MNSLALPQKVGIVDLLDRQHIAGLQQEVDSLFDDLFETYSGDWNREQFDTKFCFKESVHMMIAAFRFASRKRLDLLKNRAISVLPQSSRLGNSADICSDQEPNYLLHPLFYLHVTRPEQWDQKSQLFESSPHYDITHGLYQHTFWLAINAIDSESGGICFFKKSAEIKQDFMAKLGDKNKYHYDGYVQDSYRLDKLMRSNLVRAKLKPGQAYRFDSSVLHAGVKPTTRIRKSFDFRIIPVDKANTKLLLSNEVIRLFNEHTDFSNSMNLLMLGDIKGSLQLTPDLRYILEQDDLSSYMLYDPFKHGIQVHWRKLFCWIEGLNSSRLGQKTGNLGVDAVLNRIQ